MSAMDNRYQLRLFALNVLLVPGFFYLLQGYPVSMSEPWHTIAVIVVGLLSIACAFPYARECWRDWRRKREDRTPRPRILMPDGSFSFTQAKRIGSFYRADIVLLLMVAVLLLATATATYKTATRHAGAIDMKYWANNIRVAKVDAGTPYEYEALLVDANTTNRSAKGMALTFLLEVRFPDDGEVFTVQPFAKWIRPNETTTQTVNIPTQQSVDGTLVFPLVSIQAEKMLHPKLTINDWHDLNEDNFAIRIEDKISGVYFLSNIRDYPSSKVWNKSDPAK